MVQFAPFEVLGGQHGADLHTDLRRFFQYEYRLRLIAEGLFGKDVPLPETQAHLPRAEQGRRQDASIQGRDQSYLLPAQSVRVLSLVPADAAGHLATRPRETFADLDQRAFRANLLIVIGGVLFALAGLHGAARPGSPLHAAPETVDRCAAAGVGRRHPSCGGT